MLALVGTVSVHAQTIQSTPPDPSPPSRPAFQAGSLALAPTIRLTEFGYDSNVYNRDANNNPVADFVSTLDPGVDAWFRLGSLRVRGRSSLEMYYYNDLPQLRAVDKHNAGQVDFGVNRVRLFAMGSLDNVQRRENLEIDAIVRRDLTLVNAGAEIRLSGKTSIEASVERSGLNYAPNSLYLGSDLANVLNSKATGGTVSLGYAVTPLTRLAFSATRVEARFDTATERNAADLRLESSVEFSPRALVSGRATVGLLRRTFSNGSTPFNGTTVRVDLNYVLLGRTRFSVQANRRLEYSYLPGLADYILSDVTASVTQRLGEAWDVGGMFSRGHITYRQGNLPATPGLPSAVSSDPIPPETGLTSEFDLGYNIRKGRVGIYVQQSQRDTDVPALNRQFRRIRVGSTVTYAF